jgi:hypothetical protein
MIYQLMSVANTGKNISNRPFSKGRICINSGAAQKNARRIDGRSLKIYEPLQIELPSIYEHLHV